MLRFLDHYTTFARGLTLRLLSFGMIAWFMLDWAPQFMSHSGGLEPLDARFDYSVAEAEALLAALGDEGRAFYLRMAGMDVLFMLIAGLGDWMLITLLLRRVGVGTWPRAILIIGYGADFLENVMYGSALLGAPSLVLGGAAAATLVKQCCAMLVLLTYALGLTYWGWQRVSRAGASRQSSSEPAPRARVVRKS
jgi:hypothetical protein